MKIRNGPINFGHNHRAVKYAPSNHLFALARKLHSLFSGRICHLEAVILLIDLIGWILRSNAVTARTGLGQSYVLSVNKCGHDKSYVLS